MTTANSQRIFLDDLARRWRQDADRIVELASGGTLPLWISFTDVIVQKSGKPSAPAARKRKAPTRERHVQIEVQPVPEVLGQILGRCDRMLIAAELPCLDAKGKAVAISNTVGDEWGETSMIGLKPAMLFALLDDVEKYERKNKIIPATVQIEHQKRPVPSSDEMAVDSTTLAAMPPELRAATACWRALLSQQGAQDAAVSKADILAWLQQHHPELTKAARERLALVISPAKGGCR